MHEVAHCGEKEYLCDWDADLVARTAKSVLGVNGYSNWQFGRSSERESDYSLPNRLVYNVFMTERHLDVAHCVTFG